MLSLYKRLDFFRTNQKEHRWEKARNIKEVYGSIVLIVGCDSVGIECAKSFKAFGCKIVGIDIATRDDENYDAIRQLKALDTELALADIVILTIPLTEETKGLMDARRLNIIRGDAVLVNISRVAVIDQSALEQWNGNAVLDAFEEEPLPDNSLVWGRPSFMITPQNSFVGNGNTERLSYLVLNNLDRKC